MDTEHVRRFDPCEARRVIWHGDASGFWPHARSQPASDLVFSPRRFVVTAEHGAAWSSARWRTRGGHEGDSQEPQGFAGEDGRRAERRGGVRQRQHQQPAPARVQTPGRIDHERIGARVQVRRPRAHLPRPGSAARHHPAAARRRRRRRAGRAPPRRRRARGRPLPQVVLRRPPRGVADGGSERCTRAHPLGVRRGRRREGRVPDRLAHDARPTMRPEARGHARGGGIRGMGRVREVGRRGIDAWLERSALSAR